MINYLAVLAAAVAGVVIGTLWYSKFLFGKFMKSLSSKENKKKGMNSTYVYSFLSMLVMSYILAWFIGLGPVTVSMGVLKSFLLWLGFIATTQIDMILWEKKPGKLYVLKTAQDLAALLVMGLILSFWI